ncbi:hypothetical protein D5S19_26885 [Amycolatopsis panacis]|uniref:Mce-associated membrane protein n=1 Tax=Amycolatopsis panacis TaxID=2340917 RepID=A0A419HRG8_9PSEU|nr:hypothetical protein D5S19_26885 [Amycolatopsis panacis]
MPQELRPTSDTRPARHPAPRPAPAAPEPPETLEVLDVQETAELAQETPEVDALTGAPSATPRPSPRRKQRDTGRAKPVDVAEAEAQTRDQPAAVPPTPERAAANRTTTYAAVLLIVGLILAAAAVIFNVKYQEAQDSVGNVALLDAAKTAQVKDSVSKATEALFSYDYNNIKKTEDAANSLLANDEVKARYTALMGQVKKLAPQQKMVVTCKVSRAAVIRIDGDLARVMVFVDQTSTRADTKQTAAGTAQLHVDAQLEDSTWKITDLDTYKAAPGAPAPSSSAPAAPPSK